MLFSEPKIPQFCADVQTDAAGLFQCSSASRKFLNENEFSKLVVLMKFQCSSASRKFLNQRRALLAFWQRNVSVLFSEPKIPQCGRGVARRGADRRFSALQRAENSSMALAVWGASRSAGFSALQRAENSSIPTLAPASIHIPDCDDHASSFLSLPGASP